MYYLRNKAFMFALSLGAILTIFLSNKCLAAEPGQIVLRWKSAGNINSSGGAERYVIKYSLIPISESNWATAREVDNPPSPKAASTAQEILISGLEPGRKYYVAIKALDVANNASPLSSVVVSFASGIMTPDIVGAKFNSEGQAMIITHPVESRHPILYQFALDKDISFNNQIIVSAASSDSCVALPQQKLDSASKYYVRCRAIAFDHSDSSAWSAPESLIVSQNLLSKRETPDQIPNEYFLAQSYPNPFNPSATIRYGLPEEAQVTITIYDILGRTIQVLVNERQTAGYHQIIWHAGNLPSGTYLYRIRAGDYSASKKMQLLK
jgi:hypothetical protein